jgi:pimeloyl-ACP methyl ester carboxylesterase
MAEQIIAPDPEDPQRREQLMERMLSLPQEVLASTWDAYVEYDAAQAAAQCKVPVLHVGGVFPADLERLQSLCPQLVTSHVDGAGHFIQLHATPQVIDELERFLTLVHEPASV